MSSSSSRHRRGLTDEQLPTLDLHGNRLPTAISRTTAFLDTVMIHHRQTCPFTSHTSHSPKSCHCKVRCNLISGSGSHSSATGGPILRSAISKLLTKRCMDFGWTPGSGRGSFTVDANSGIELFGVEEGRRVDSKVLVRRRDCGDEWELSGGLPGSRAREGRIGATAAMAKGARGRGHDPNSCRGYDGRQPSFSLDAASRNSDNASNPNGNGSKANDKEGEEAGEETEAEEVYDVYPLPAEVCADDALISHIKKMTASEAMAAVQQQRSDDVRERDMIQRAVEISHQEKKEEQVEKSSSKEREEMERAMKLSREESLRSAYNDDDEGEEGEEGEDAIMSDEEFERLLELSRVEEMERKRREEERETEELEEVLRLSEEVNHGNGDGHDDDDDEEMKRILSLSVKETTLNDNDNGNDEDEIQRAIRESLAMSSEDGAVGLDGVAGDGRLDDDEADMIRRAVELSIRAEEERTMVEEALAVAAVAAVPGAHAVNEEMDNVPDSAHVAAGALNDGRGGSTCTGNDDTDMVVAALGEPPPSSTIPPCSAQSMYID
mmetsp:Transcript_38050/g.83562  ORF Transcript_38050/g.83562 Transcript_38050/m.83562 type:complete len:551 (+) Transcript_38050:77-1729(+)